MCDHLPKESDNLGCPNCGEDHNTDIPWAFGLIGETWYLIKGLLKLTVKVDLGYEELTTRINRGYFGYSPISADDVLDVRELVKNPNILKVIKKEVAVGG